MWPSRWSVGDRAGEVALPRNVTTRGWFPTSDVHRDFCHELSDTKKITRGKRQHLRTRKPPVGAIKRSTWALREGAGRRRKHERLACHPPRTTRARSIWNTAGSAPTKRIAPETAGNESELPFRDTVACHRSRTALPDVEPERRPDDSSLPAPVTAPPHADDGVSFMIIVADGAEDTGEDDDPQGGRARFSIFFLLHVGWRAQARRTRGHVGGASPLGQAAQPSSGRRPRRACRAISTRPLEPAIAQRSPCARGRRSEGTQDSDVAHAK